MSGILRPGDRELAATLGLAARRRYAGTGTGEERSPEPGGGIEFADYRPYIPGDDPRRVDWDVWRRLGRLFVRIPADERELSLLVVLDASRSMDQGSPSKLEHAKRLASIFAALALGGGNRVGLAVLGPGLIELRRPTRGRSSLEAFEEAAARVGSLGDFEPLAAAEALLARYGRRGPLVLLSDLMFPAWKPLLGALAGSGCEVQVLQILAREELEPPERGETTFVDAEDLSEAPLHIDERALRRYEEELSSFLRETRQECSRLGLAWALAPSDGEPAPLFRGELRGGGFLC